MNTKVKSITKIQGKFHPAFGEKYLVFLEDGSKFEEYWDTLNLFFNTKDVELIVGQNWPTEDCGYCKGTGTREKNIPSGENNLEQDVEVVCGYCDGSGKTYL